MISADIKTDVKQQIKEPCVQLYLKTFHKSIFSKLEIKYRARLGISSSVIVILSPKNRVMGGGMGGEGGWIVQSLNEQNLLSAAKVM